LGLETCRHSSDTADTASVKRIKDTATAYPTFILEISKPGFKLLENRKIDCTKSCHIHLLYFPFWCLSVASDFAYGVRFGS